MRRRLTTTSGVLLALGVAVVALAAILAIATIGDNTLQTGEFEGPPDLLQIALVDSVDGDCNDPDLTWTTASATPIFDQAALQYTFPDALGADAPVDVCMRAQALLGEYFGVVASTVNVVSDEATGCPDARESSVGDDTCGVGTGELGTGLTIVYERREPSAPGSVFEGQCISPDGGGSGEAGRVALEEGQSALLAVLKLEAMCRYSVRVTTAVPYPDIQRYSSDTLSFDLQFTADDTQTELPALP